LVGVFGLVLVINGVVLKPARLVDEQIGGLRRQLEKVKNERRAYFTDEDKVKGFTLRSFDDDLDEASAKSGEMLTRLLAQSGLRESDFTRLPVGPRRLRGADEIGWNVQGEGPLMSVVNLLYLLEESPYLHRLENLTLSVGDAPGHVRVGFRFLTLVINPAPAVDSTNLVARLTLDSPERRVLDSIVQRDLLRPYVKRPPPPPAAPGGTRPATPAATPAGPESLRVVSLSEWGGQPEVHVRDLVNQRTLVYRQGDPMAGGVITMVDYRSLPSFDRPGFLSDSRVILQIASEYWAVERGRTLAEKHKLAPEQLPETLTRK
jgi:hypothetical protein